MGDWTDDEIKEMIESLKKEGVLIPKKTNYGEQVSINVGLNELVMKYIEAFLKKRDWPKSNE
ncbi:MAG: hypothetical protein AABX47_04890 [Nanoarchaeota archaeon]